jgi:hypothetical protein
VPPRVAVAPSTAYPRAVAVEPHFKALVVHLSLECRLVKNAVTIACQAVLSQLEETKVRGFHTHST